MLVSDDSSRQVRENMGISSEVSETYPPFLWVTN